DEASRRFSERGRLNRDRRIRKTLGPRLDVGSLDASGERIELGGTAHFAVKRPPVLVSYQSVFHRRILAQRTIGCNVRFPTCLTEPIRFLYRIRTVSHRLRRICAYRCPM